MPGDDQDRLPLPPYQQIAADLRGQITSGVLPPGALVPSITRLSQEYEVSRNTAVKALQVLAREGLTYRVHGWGTFVTGGSGGHPEANDHARLISEAGMAPC